MLEKLSDEELNEIIESYDLIGDYMLQPGSCCLKLRRLVREEKERRTKLFVEGVVDTKRFTVDLNSLSQDIEVNRNLLADGVRQQRVIRVCKADDRIIQMFSKYICSTSIFGTVEYYENGSMNIFIKHGEGHVAHAFLKVRLIY